MWKHSFLLSASFAVLSAVQAQNCSNLVVNGGFESSTGSGGSAGFASCSAGVPNWTPSIVWPPGTTSVAGSLYVPVRNGTSAFPLENFFAGGGPVNPDSWDANAANTRYAGFRIVNSNSTGKVVRLALSQTLTSALQVGTKYVVRARYAAYTVSGTANASMNVAMRFNSVTTCPPTYPGGTTTVGSENMNISSTSPVGLGWNTMTTCFTATTAHTRGHLGFNFTVPANTQVMVYADAIDVRKMTCPFDLNSDGLIGTGDLTILIGYSGVSTDNILNICHTAADSNCDGIINATDVTAFNAVFGTVCPSGLILQDEVREAEGLTKSASPGTADTGVVLAPNPTPGRCTLLHPALIGTGTVTVVDMSGRTVLQVPLGTGGLTELDLTAAPSAAYAVTITTPSGVDRLRLVKE